DLVQEFIDSLGVDDLLRRVTPEQRLAGLDPEQRLAGLDPEQLTRALRSLPLDVQKRIRKNLKDS
ncbi:MAG: hypothetical protein MJE77_25050, partial [Proteobacteria bacterium]|nr:hypothetical protein [Pseudomonadota bacterium]